MNKPANFTSKASSRFAPGGQSQSQALLEFALALPVLLMVIFGIIDFALLFQAWLSVENIARQTVRYAVTGQYLVQNCADYDAGTGKGCQDTTNYLAQQDAARLITIKQVARQWEVAIFMSGAPDNTAKGYLNVTLCSNRDADHNGTPDFTYVVPLMAQPVYAECNPSEDAGGPGDNVYVFVDFNHPLITPFLSQVWPMIHLASYREGVVETFRTARSISQPEGGIENTLPPPPPSDTPTPSNTPSPTATATNTGTNTATATSTATNTRTATSTASQTPTRTLTPTPSNTPTQTLVPTTTLTKLPTLTPTITKTPSRTPTRTPTRTPSRTPTPSLTFTPSNTPTRTFTPTITFTPSRTSTPTLTFTPSNTPTRTSTPSPTNTPTPSRTPTQIIIPTSTKTQVPSPTIDLGG